MTRVLVTGSSGEIGSALVQALRFDTAVELVATADLRPGPLHLANDIASITPQLLERQRIDTILHTAYPVEPSHNPAQARQTATTSFRSLLAAAHDAGVQTFLHLSSATVYGAHANNPPLLTESTPLQPNLRFFYAQDKAAAEQILAASPPFRTQIILRPSFVLGATTANPFIRHICRPVVPLPSTESPMQFVHLEDLVRIALTLVRHRLSGIFNVGAPGALFPTAMVRRLGNRPFPLPDRLLDLANTLAWHSRLPWSPAPTAALDLLRHPWRVDSTALASVLAQPYSHTTEQTFQTFAEAFLARRHSRSTSGRTTQT